MIALPLPSPSFKRKGKASTIIEFEGEEGVGQSVNAVKVVNDKPDVLDFVSINLERVLPGFVTVACGAPKKIPDVCVAMVLPVISAVVVNAQSEFQSASN